MIYTRYLQRTIISIVFVTALFALPAHAQGDVLVQGKLDNGLTYYISNGGGTPGQVQYYLYQNVGAILEDDNQQGLAHVLEHLAFNTTDNFPEGVMTFLRGKGINTFTAHTGVDETRFSIQAVPAEDAALNDKMLQILRDWCHGIKITPKDVDKERAIVLEEWRQRNNIDHRLSDAIAPAIFNHSMYANRNVIGTEQQLRTFKVDEVKKFYDKWYRPSRQFIAIIGDINPEDMEAKVKKLFVSLPAKEVKETSDVRTIADNAQMEYLRFIDKENVSPSFGLYQRTPKADKAKAVNELLYTRFFNQLAPRRFARIKNNGTESFIAASVSYSPLTRNYYQVAWDVVPYAGKEIEALNEMLQVRSDLRQNGFSKAEFDEIKDQMYKGMKELTKEEGLGTPDNLVDQYRLNFLYGDPIIDFRQQLNTSLEHLVEMEVEDLNAWVAEKLTDNNLAFITYSQREDEMNITREQALTAIEENKKPIIAERAMSEIGDKLIDFNIPQGKITAAKDIPQLGAKEWTLSNGAKVYYKYDQSTKGKVFFVGDKPGGKSIVEAAKLPAYKAMTALAMQSGVYKYSRNQLYEWVKNKDFYLTLSPTDYADAVGGSTSVADATAFFQYLYLVLAKQEFNQSVFDKYVQRSKYIYITRSKGGMAAVQDSISQLMFPVTDQNPIENEAFYDRMTLQGVKDAYKAHFGNAANFRFCLVGDIPEVEARNLVETYIASLPNEKDSQPTKPKLIDFSAKDAIINRRFEADVEGNVGEVEITYLNTKELSSREQAALEVFRGMLENRYFSILRERDHATYTIGVKANYTEEQAPAQTLSIHFQTSREKAELLRQEAIRLLKEMAAGKFTNDEFKAVQVPLAVDEQTSNEDRESFKGTTDYWLGMLNIYAETGKVSTDLFAPNTDYINLTTNDIKAVAEKILGGARLRTFIVKSLPAHEQSWEK